jgi:hypothetical protein
MDDFFFLANSYHATLLVRTRVYALFTRIGLLHNVKKGIWTPTQVGDHLGLTIDLHRGEFQVQHDKLYVLPKQGSSLGHVALNA